MGNLFWHEPENTETLRANVEVFSIFEMARWTVYFQQLNGFHKETALPFSLNLTDTHSTVKGLHIDVTKEDVAEVTGLTQVGRIWFGRKALNATAV